MLTKKLFLFWKIKKSNSSKNDDNQQNQYSKFGIGFRLIAAFSIVSALTLLISGVGWFSLDTLTDAQKTIVEEEVPAISLALKLAKDTTLISAEAPQLGLAANDAERTNSIQKLNLAIDTATNRLEKLNDFVEEDPALIRIDNSLKNLAPLVQELDSLVKQRLVLTALRQEKLKRLEVLRKILKKEIGPLMIPLRMQMFENEEKMEELVEAAVGRALTGEQPEYDTATLAESGRQVLFFQENILSFQSSGFLMLSLLAEGALADTPKAVDELANAFLASLSSMATPFSKIRAKGKGKAVENLTKLFEELLLVGAKGNDQQLVFKIRSAELEAGIAAEKILKQSRDLAESLSVDANTFVTAVEESVQIATEKNAALAQQIKITLAAAAVAAVLIALAIGWLYIARNIIRRLMMMVDSARKLSEGDLKSSIYREGRDEIAQLGFALVGFRDAARQAELDRTAAEVERQKRDDEKTLLEKERLENVQSANAEQERMADEAEATKRQDMNNLADEFEGSVKHLVTTFASATKEMTTISRSMTVSAEETTTLTGTVASASKMSSNSINSVAAATEELASSINEISSQVSQAATIAGEAVAEAERSNNMVKSLDEAASKIGDVVGLINDIAGQTNLLALNATIEAARAGDAGKGFAVVASEVKNLATQTAKATEDISEQIKTVQEQTGFAVDAIGGIGSTIGRINDIATSISAAVEEQGAATSEISRSVQQAAEGAQNVTANIGSVNQTANTTGESASKVQEVAGRLATDVSGLDQEVERFLSQVRVS